MGVHGRVVVNGMHQVAGSHLGWQNTPAGLLASEFVATRSYTFLVTGRIGGFVSGTSSGPADVNLVVYDSATQTVVAGIVGTHHVNPAATELAEKTINPATTRVGFPFVMIGQHTFGADVYDVILQAHGGSSAHCYVSDLCVWYFDQTLLGTNHVATFTTLARNLARHPTWTSSLSTVALTHGGGPTAERWLVAFSARVSNVDLAIAYRMRVMSGAGFATPFLGADATSRPIGAAAAGGIGGQTYRLGSFRVFELAAGSDTLLLQGASALGGTGSLQVMDNSAMFAVNLAAIDDRAHAYSANVAGLFGINGLRGGPHPLTFTPDTQYSGPRYYFLSSVAHESGSGASWKTHLRLGGQDRSGNQSLHVWQRDPGPIEKAALPVISHSLLELLGHQPTTVDVQGLQNPGETPAVAVQPGTDVTVLAVSQASGLALVAPVMQFPGSGVQIRLGREGPALSAQQALPVEPDYPLAESREFTIVDFEAETGHHITFPARVAGRSVYPLTWTNLSAADKALLVPFLEARPGRSWKWTPQGGVEGAYMYLGGRFRRSLVNPGVYSAEAEVLELIFVGP